ncbi:MAG: AAA family ATPase [Chloroflexi bacterium]|nr:MAG: AAA family ATPase [Chloroflexota bacterium]
MDSRLDRHTCCWHSARCAQCERRLARRSEPGRWCRVVDDRTTSFADDAEAEQDLLLTRLPERIATAARAAGREGLIEVVMDLGRLATARYSGGREIPLTDQEVTEQDIDQVVSQISEFGEDNRAGIPRTLHRISAIRNRRGRIVGLTCRIGRSVTGSASVLRDLIDSGKSVLLLGPPGVGKTTMLREAARVLADDLHKRVVIVDSSNEIGGDGDIPHPGVGRARRMQVARPEQQHEVMIEAVENHTPEVIVIDEIGTALEALAARTIAERGVQLIGTAHGNQLANLMQNPTLSDLIGGIESVTLGDEEARRRGTQKTVLERRAPPTFTALVEIQAFNRVAVHEDIAATVDTLLRGFEAEAEIRTIGADGQITELERVAVALEDHGEHIGMAREGGDRRDFRPRNGDREREREPREMHEEREPRTPRRIPPAPGGPQRRILAFGISRARLEEAIGSSRSAATVVDSIQDADAVMTLRPYYRRRAGPIRDAEVRGIPVHVLRNNTVAQIEQALLQMRGPGQQEDPTTAALRETEDAIAAVAFDGQASVELAPQNAYIRRLQHELASRHGVESTSRGREPYRHVLVTATGGVRPRRDETWDEEDLRA